MTTASSPEPSNRPMAPQLTATQWRRVLINLLLVQAMLLVPVAMMLPSWLVLVPMATGYWQWQVVLGRQHNVPRLLKWALALGLPPLLLLHGLHPGAVDFYVALAFIGVALKLIEMRTYRDAFLVAMMAQFVLASLLLLDQGLLFALYVFVGSSLALAALVRLHAPRGIGLGQAWRASGKALVLALPFMLLLFVLFPRLPPVWQIPAGSSVGRTGLSETLAPGEIAQLVQSDEVVFRARFAGATPAREDLYWRAMTLHHFDGQRWYQWDERPGLPTALVGTPELPLPQFNSATWTYEMAVAATQQLWVATLEHLVQFSSNDAVWLADHRLAWPEKLQQAQRLRVQSARHIITVDELDETLRAAALALPARGNPQARALASRWHAEVQGDAQAFATRVMQHFATEPYRYSLRPGRASDLNQAIDQFLFTAQVGFCEHYAEAMVFLARSAGIPARIVAGYLGGQWSADDSYLVVRSQEAHAWAELWIDGAGWVRFDPTMMVAPDRMERSLGEMLSEEQDLLRPAAWSDATAPTWLQNLYWRMDGVQYRWQRWVLNFDNADRLSLLQQWWGGVSVTQFAAGAVATALVVFGSWLAWLRWGNPWHFFALSNLEQRARRCCVTVFPDLPPQEGLTMWVTRLRDKAPDLAVALADFADSYLPLRYGRGTPTRRRTRATRHKLAKLRRVAKAHQSPGWKLPWVANRQ